MDLDTFQQNMNTRVVFKEPRGMIRWIQLLFAIIAFATVVDFYTTIGINIVCPPLNTTIPVPAPVQPVAPQPVLPQPVAPQPVAPQPVAPPPVAPQPAPAAAAQNVAQAVTTSNAVLTVQYPFDFKNVQVVNGCPGYNFSYTQVASLNGSPQFFVMTGILSLMYVSAALTIYLFFSSTYDSIPVFPVADLIVSAILCLFWFIASSSFSSGVSLLKSTANYESLSQVICPAQLISHNGVCTQTDVASWKSLNVALVSGFTSFFLWGASLWFVFKETHFHTPRNQFGPR